MLLLMYQDKGHFPFLFKDINYIGTLPGIDFWTDITYLEYNAIYAKYKHQLWSFRNEAIKYCKLDCMSLYAVIVKFNKLIFSEFKVNIHSSLTLSSLAMRIYKTQYMPNNTIYQILGSVRRDIKKSYTPPPRGSPPPRTGRRTTAPCFARHKAAAAPAPAGQP